MDGGTRKPSGENAELPDRRTHVDDDPIWSRNLPEKLELGIDQVTEQNEHGGKLTRICELQRRTRREFDHTSRRPSPPNAEDTKRPAKRRADTDDAYSPAKLVPTKFR